jgi:hypothetical protein
MRPPITDYMRLAKALQIRLSTNSEAVHKGQSTTLGWLNMIDAASKRIVAGSGVDNSRGRSMKWVSRKVALTR